MDTTAELSSLAATLDEVTERAGQLAESLRDERQEEAAVQLYEIERSLIAAKRRLAAMRDKR